MLKSLLQAHAPFFAPHVRQRGDECLRSGHVQLDEVSARRAKATVTGASNQRVVLDNYADPVRMQGSCDCPTFEDDGDCEHVWAVLAAIEDAQHEAELGTAKPTKPASAPASPTSPPAVRTQSEARAELESWRRRLAGVVPTEPARDPSIEQPVLEFFLETRPYRGPRDDGSLYVSLRSRKRKRSGELGVPRTAPLTPEEVALLGAADRALLLRYERDAHQSHGALGLGKAARGPVRLSHPWWLPDGALPQVLPLLSAVRRTFVGPAPVDADSDEPPVPLRIDTEEPFHFEVLYRAPTAEAGEHAPGHLHGLLCRGEDIQPLDSVRQLPSDHVLLLPGRLIRLELGGAQDLARELVRHGPIEVPHGDLAHVLGALARVPGSHRFLARAIADLPPTKPVGRVLLRLAKATDEHFEASLQFAYEGTIVLPGDDRPLVQEATALVRRDFAAESQCSERAQAAGLQRREGDAWRCAREAIGNVIPALFAAGLVPQLEGRPLRTFVAGRGTVHTAGEWLEVAGAVEFTDQTSSLPELLRRRLLPEGLLELGDGSFGLLPERWLRRIETLRQLGPDLDDRQIRLPLSQALVLDAMLAHDGEDFTVDAPFAALRERFAAFRSVAPAMEPASFCGELRPYQRQGLGWLSFLREFGLGGCLADDMGLGKTVQVLAYLATVCADTARAVRPSLLVAPRSVLTNWLAEAKKFVPSLRVLDFSKSDRWQASVEELAHSDLVLTTYGLLRTDAAEFEQRAQRFHHVILDEAHVAKNADSQTSKAVRLLRAHHRLAITGTPVENHLGELWSLFEFLNPGMLGRLNAFRGLFEAGTSPAALARHRQVVQGALRPVMLRRTKSQVLKDLPEKIEQTLWCDLEPDQRRRYDEMKRYYKQRLLAAPLPNESGVAAKDQGVVVLEALLRLRQAACHEALLDPARLESSSAKLDALLPRLEELAEEGHKALVFSQFTGFLDLVEPHLRARGIEWTRIDGSTGDRAARVERFQNDPKCAVFLISLKAGGVGLNLTAADYVFLLDPWWNPAAESQAIDRAHRYGQKRVVHAFRMVCRGTVEERVLELQAQKRALCDAVFGGERSLLQGLSRGDLELLLG